jgi:hypothetical protein
MRSIVLAGLGVALLAAGPSWSQDADDWDFAEDRSRNLTIAAVTFDTLGIAVRCMDGNLSLILSGLPEGSGERTLHIRFGDLPEMEDRWVSAENSGTLFAIWPRGMASLFSRGAPLSIRTADGDVQRRYVVDLPPSQTAVRRTLQACGEELDDFNPTDVPTGELPPDLVWTQRPAISFPQAPASTFALAALTCEVEGSGRLRNCRAESEFPAGSGFGRAAALGAHRTGRVQAVGDARSGLEGRRVSFTVRYRLMD